MRSLSLFSGIGGFDLAAEWAGIEVAGMVEWDSFCQEVLRKHWPDVKILGDIHEVTGKEFGTIDIIYGGFPCQSFSVAGKRKGRGDDRYLWPEMFRIIREVHPRWCLAENVPGLISIDNGMVFEQVCADLESENYQVQAFIIGAVAVNAPHRRDRVWIIANCRCESESGAIFKRENGLETKKQNADINKRPDCDAPDATESGLSLPRLAGIWKLQTESGAGIHDRLELPNWETPWPIVAASTCNGRVDDGLPAEFHQRRAERLKALGNSIVPAVAYEIIKRIAEIERTG